VRDFERQGGIFTVDLARRRFPAVKID